MVSGESFSRIEGELACEEVPLKHIAERYGTPCYVYSAAAITQRFQRYKEALAGLSHRICYSVKANSNLSILKLLAAEGAGFDIVSGGELYRVMAAGGDPASVVFSGVGKTEDEIRFALERSIHSFNCESVPELETISRLASMMGKQASVALRINPDVNAVTHPYISTGLREHKFGIDIKSAPGVYDVASRLPGLRVEGVSCHIGSQIVDIGPLLEAADRAIELVRNLRSSGIDIRYLDLGGGLGVAYRSGEHSADPSSLVTSIKRKLDGLDLTLMLEPGRSIVAEAGVLLVRVLLVKTNGAKKFVIVDGALNDLIRPALYQAYHEIEPVAIQREAEEAVDVVGPVCETGDFFARSREMQPVQAGDLLAIRTAGAYGFVLSSNYNSRPRPPELLVSGKTVSVARARETYADLIRGEGSCA